MFFEHPLGDKMLNIFMFGDHHYLNSIIQNRPQKMINILPTLKFLKDHRPWDVVIFGGDTWDLDYLSHWNSNRFEDIGHNRIEDYVNKEARDIYHLIKLVKDASKARTIYYFEGNHENFLWQYQEKHQKLNKQTLDQWLRFNELGITLIPVHGVLKIGKNIAIRHGECYRTMNPAQQSIVKSHRTNFLFHWHKYIVWPGYSDADVTEKLQAYCLPGMCNVCAMEFMRNQPNNWSCGFARLYVKPSGKFTPCVVPMSLQGHFIYNGVEYE